MSVSRVSATLHTSFCRYFAFDAVPGSNGASKKGSERLHQDKAAPKFHRSEPESAAVQGVMNHLPRRGYGSSRAGASASMQSAKAVKAASAAHA